jgi:hypothetical protein
LKPKKNNHHLHHLKKINWRNLVIFLLFLSNLGLLFLYQPQFFMGLLRITTTYPTIQASAPYSEEISRIIAPLRYSGYYDLLRPNVKLRFDFKQKLWAITNIHQFDSNHQLTLMEDKYGVCGDLAAYTYNKIRPLLDRDRFKIDFLEVSESSYFQYGFGTHIILRIIDRKELPRPKSYFVDPSFHRYGNIEHFENYEMLSSHASLAILDEMRTDEYYPVGYGPPITINREMLLSLSVDTVENQFNQDYFKVSLIASKRYSYRGQILFSYEMRAGQVSLTHSTDTQTKWIEIDMIEKLKNRLIVLIESKEIGSIDKQKLEASLLVNQISKNPLYTVIEK